METANTMTPAKCSALWLHCDSLGAVNGMRQAAAARRDILAGRTDTLAVGWAVAMYNQIPARTRKALLAQHAATCP